MYQVLSFHDDVIKWKYFPRYWPFVRGIHRSLVNSPHKGQWRGASMLSLICIWISGWVNNREADDLRRYRAHYDVIVIMLWPRMYWHSHVLNYQSVQFWLYRDNYIHTYIHRYWILGEKLNLCGNSSTEYCSWMESNISINFMSY